MIPFHERFPEVAGREQLVLRIQQEGLPLPPGEYGFFEWFCEDAGCDCRRALLQVISPQQPGRILATINYGWESAAFYTRWMHGDKQAGRDITSASLDPINPQSALAEALLDGFQDYARHDSFYPGQLQRHYEMFKGTQPAAPAAATTRSPLPAMTTDDILRQLQHVPEKADFAPYEEALLAAADQREAITPELIAALDRVSANPAQYLKQQADCLHLFAIYLLAQFREGRALDAFLRFFSLPGDQSLDLTGDMVTENGAAVLASVCGGDRAPLLRLAQDESVNEFVRQQAIDGLLVQSGWGERPRDAVIGDLRRLFHTLPKPGQPYIWAALVGAVYDFDAGELLPEARRAFAEGMVDEDIIGLEDLDPAVSPGPMGFPRPSAAQRFSLLCARNAPIHAVTECSGWLCFLHDNADDDAWRGLEMDRPDRPDDALGLPPYELSYRPAPVPFVAPPKVGRNDPCPCGSGKKHMKCCGKN